MSLQFTDHTCMLHYFSVGSFLSQEYIVNGSNTKLFTETIVKTITNFDTDGLLFRKYKQHVWGFFSLILIYSHADIQFLNESL